MTDHIPASRGRLGLGLGLGGGCLTSRIAAADGGHLPTAGLLDLVGWCYLYVDLVIVRLYVQYLIFQQRKWDPKKLDMARRQFSHLYNLSGAPGRFLLQLDAGFLGAVGTFRWACLRPAREAL